MGPTVLFDKSFLQSLTLDESVWFDNFFYPVVCPIFYLETVADLKKSGLNREPEEEERNKQGAILVTSGIGAFLCQKVDLAY